MKFPVFQSEIRNQKSEIGEYMWVGGNTDTFSEQRFRGRVRFISVLFASCYVVIAIRLFYLQVVRGGDFASVSESNRTQVIFLRAPRGDFYDRSGRVFVKNRPSWSVMYSVPEHSESSRIYIEKRLMPILRPFSPQWTKNLKKAFETKQMVRLVEDVPNQVAFLMREMEELLPGLRVAMEFRRGYPLGVFANHVVGYLGEISERELRDGSLGIRKSGDLVGKMGVEKIEDERLRGEDGGMLIEVDSIGRLKRIIRELPYKKGRSVHLTVDLLLQQAAEEELSKTETKRGAAVAIDVNTGAVLAWASAPTFDPLGSLADELKDPRAPFLDRVYRGAYPPGSVFKIITAITGFERGAIKLTEEEQCDGYVALVDRRMQERRYKCWKKHGKVGYWRAMAESCDSYFYLLGKKIGSQAIYETGQLFGLGNTVQNTFMGENKGLLPNPVWKKKAGYGGWSTGDTFNMSIGQGYVTNTPLQVCAMMMMLATKGTLYQPYVINRIVNSDGITSFVARPSVKKTVQLKETTWRYIDKSLENVVTRGTGQASRLARLNIHGKTGTAQNPHGEDHAWFAGYAGYKGDNPSVAICVFVENGGHGGAVAAPIMRRMLEVLFPIREQVEPA